MTCTSIGKECQPLEGEGVKRGRNKRHYRKVQLLRWKVKRRDVLATKRRTQNGGGDFSDGQVPQRRQREEMSTRQGVIRATTAMPDFEGRSGRFWRLCGIHE